MSPDRFARLGPQLLIVGVITLAMPVSATAAGALWGKPRRLSAAGASNPAVAVNAHRAAIVAWSRPDLRQGNRRIEAVTRSARGWGAPRLLGRANPLMGRSPVVAMDAGGDAFVGWIGSGDNALHVATGAPGGAWTASVVAGTARDAVLAADDAGDAVAAWVRLGQVLVALRPRGGGWAAPVALSKPSGTELPQVVMSGSGDTVVLWRASVRGRPEVQAALRPAGQPFGAVQTLSAPGIAATSPTLASDAAGDVAAAWTGGPLGHEVIQVAIRRAGQPGFDQPATVATRRIVSPVDVAVGPHGRATVTWVSTAVEAAQRTASGHWGRPRRLSPKGDSIDSVAQTVTDRGGDTTVVWSGSSRSKRRLNAVQAADRLRHHGWRSAQVVSSAAEQDASDATVALGSGTYGLLMWRSRLPGTGTFIWAAPRRARTIRAR
jgi:hypothetical protein